MSVFEIIFYRKANGAEPLRKFLDSLPTALRSKAVRDLDVLKENGSKLRLPYSRHLRDGLFELRIQTKGDDARIFYFFFSKGKIVVTNGFVKKSQKTPARELRRALRYKKDWEERHHHDYL